MALEVVTDGKNVKTVKRMTRDMYTTREHGTGHVFCVPPSFVLIDNKCPFFHPSPISSPFSVILRHIIFITSHLLHVIVIPTFFRQALNITTTEYKLLNLILFFIVFNRFTVV